MIGLDHVVLNVSRGGSLIQDIPTQLPKSVKHDQGSPRDRKSHAITVNDGSMIRKLAGASSQMVNSHHHQAVDRIGRDLVATASTSDGVMEAIEDSRPDRWVVGVQWHPELGWADDPLSSQLFDAFVQASLKFKLETWHSRGRELPSVGND